MNYKNFINYRMKATIIINTNNQNEFLERAILSCIRQNYFDYELIVANLSKNKDYKIEKKYKKNSRIRFLNLREKYLYPTQNQLFAIKQSLKFSKGKHIFLLDGDDFFLKNKINFILNRMKNSNITMDLPVIFKEVNKKEIKKIKINKLKKNFFYKNFINNWPSISCTSGICVKKNIMHNFFKETNPFIWKNLAIDIQIAIYASQKNTINYENRDLTYKSDNFKNLDKSYSNYFHKRFWIRRNEQHMFNLTVNKKIKFKGLDYYITKIITFFIFQFYSVKTFLV